MTIHQPPLFRYAGRWFVRHADACRVGPAAHRPDRAGWCVLRGPVFVWERS